MPFHRISLALVVVATTGALLAGCEASVSTGGNDLNTGDAEKVIQQQYPPQAGGLKLTSIDCDSTEAKVGNTFTCKATNSAGLDLDIEGTIDKVDDDGNNAHFKTKVVKAVSDGTYFEDKTLENLQKQGYAVESVSCPETLMKKGNKTECDLTMKNGTKQTATITQTNGDGDFNISTSGPE